MFDAPGTFRVELSGEYDIGRAAELRDSLLARQIDEGVVVVDLSGVTFLDSSGLRALVEARGMLDEQGAQLIVAEPSDCVRRLLDITGTSAMFGVE
jgi:anti-sigma B factor antagonist